MNRSVAAWLSIVLLATCGACTRRPAEARPVRVGYIPIADCTQLYVAIEQGFFEQVGIEVELVSLAGGAKILEALGAGSLDVGFSNVISLVLARAAGLPFLALTGGPAQDADHKDHAVLVRQDSGIRTVADLAGKRIALNTRRNIDDLMVRLLLEKHGVAAGDVSFLEVPFPRMLSVLESGDVDAIAAIEPFVTFGRKMPGNAVLTYNYLEIQPVTEISTYVVPEAWLRDCPDTARAFQHALNRAATYANEHPSEVRELLTRYTRLEADQVADIGLPFFTSELSASRLDEMAARVRRLGWVAHVPAADEMIATF